MHGKPLVVQIPHQLGRQVARQRIENGLARIRTEVAAVATITYWEWIDDRLEFRLRLLYQQLTGCIEVLDQVVRVEVDLPWIMGALAGPIGTRIREVGIPMLSSI
jgi:hypothetical protein